MGHPYGFFSRTTSNLTNMVVFCLWTPGMRGQPLEGAQDLLSLPPPQLTNPFHTPAPSILTSSSSEMLRSRMVSDLRANSGRFLDTSPWTPNENTDEFLLNSAYGIYPGLRLIKRTRWILTLLRWYGGLNILKLGFHGGNTSLPYAGNFLFSLQGFSSPLFFLVLLQLWTSTSVGYFVCQTTKSG